MEDNGNNQNDNEKKIRFLRSALYFAFGAFVLLWTLMILQGCTPQTTTQGEASRTSGGQLANNRVVLYCSVDEVYAKPLIKQLESQTGLKIDALFDTEATKTAGLANRIRAERDRVRADVFWSSALLQTLLMSDEGLLEEYDSPAAKDVPASFKGKDWAGVGTRARVAMHDMRMASFDRNTPSMVVGVSGNTLDLGGPLGISNPQFGTASDWATALSGRLGEKKTLQFFRDLKKRGVRVLPGNGDVARAVADGQLVTGVTDSDDFLAQLKRSKKDFRPYQTVATNNAIMVPGAVSILKGSPNPEGAKKLFDAIVSAQNEKALIQQMPGVFSLRRLKDKANWQSGGVDFSFMMNAPPDDYAKWPATWRQIREPLNQIFAS